MAMRTFFRLIVIALTVLLVGLLGLAGVFYQPDVPVGWLRAKYANASSTFLNVDGVAIHYRDEGPLAKGPALDSVPLVLLHGTGASLLTWEGWTRRLKAERRVVRLDLPAYGLTGPRPDGDYSMPAYVAFLHHFLQKKGIRRCDLAGNSLGGAIAWRFALTHPLAVRNLILVDAAGYPLQSTSVPLAFRLARIPGLSRLLTFVTPRFVIEKSVRAVYAEPNRVSDSLVTQYYDMALRAGNRAAFIQRMRGPDSDSAWRQLPALRQRTLVLWGQRDGLIPVSNAYRFHRDLPRDTLVILPDAGHVPMEERPAETAGIVRRFLKEK